MKDKFLVVGFDRFGQFSFGPFEDYDSAFVKLREIQQTPGTKVEIRTRLEIDVTPEQRKQINAILAGR